MTHTVTHEEEVKTMDEKTETAADLIARLKGFLSGLDLTREDVEFAIRYAEHGVWMESAKARIDSEKATLEQRRRDIEFMEEFHKARLETERSRQIAAESEMRYWNKLTALLNEEEG